MKYFRHIKREKSVWEFLLRDISLLADGHIYPTFFFFFVFGQLNDTYSFQGYLMRTCYVQDTLQGTAEAKMNAVSFLFT